MYRLLGIAVVVSCFLLGCASLEDEEAERRREMFRLPRVKLPQAPGIDKVGPILEEADRYYYNALAKTDPYERAKLMRVAVARYEQAARTLRDVRDSTLDPERREEISYIIILIEAEIDDAVSKIPITGE